jgi:hypothetical protein
MTNKVKIFLEDDNEILGNGIGDPHELQFIRTKEYVELLTSHNIKSTFYMDMGHYIFLLKNRNNNEKFKKYFNSIEETIGLLIKNKMDVQLHVHSQWHKAEIIKDDIQVTDNWNLGVLNENDQDTLLNEAFHSLAKIFRKFDHKKKIVSYKAGSWGLQPFKNIHKILNEKNISLLLGPAKDIKSTKMKTDYTSLQSEISPYFPNPSNINEIGEKNNLFIIPIAPTYLNWFDLVRYYTEKKIQKILRNKKSLKKTFEDMKLDNKININFAPYETHMKINSQKFWFLKNTFNRSYKKIIKNDFDYKVLVIETHTKDFKNNLKDIDKFFKYIISNYENIEFVTSEQIIEDYKKNIFVPLNSNEV